jgi:hypothetical protein
MQILRALVCGILACLACGCANHVLRPPALTQPPLVVSDTVRESLPNDYFRVSFLSAGVKVTSLSRPGALRAFVTATPLYAPPLRLQELPYYSGLVNDDRRVLVAMRCRPPQPDKVDAVLATWPNVFLAIQRDVPVDQGACAATSDNTATQMACYAKAFTDPPATAVPLSLAHTFSYAGALYDDQHAAMAKWLQDNYGIFPAFAGSGYSIKDSYSLSTEPMTSQQILVKSISSEYILKNVSLSEAGCRCISVAPYAGRSNDPLDPDFVAKAGGDGVCTSVDKLVVSSR